jgi:hypothetical protein
MAGSGDRRARFTRLTDPRIGESGIVPLRHQQRDVGAKQKVGRDSESIRDYLLGSAIEIGDKNMKQSTYREIERPCMVDLTQKFCIDYTFDMQ